MVMELTLGLSHAPGMNVSSSPNARGPGPAGSCGNLQPAATTCSRPGLGLSAVCAAPSRALAEQAAASPLTLQTILVSKRDGER